MRISDWSSDVCSSDLRPRAAPCRPCRVGDCQEAGYRVADRSEARRGGKECVRRCRSRGSPYHSKKKVPGKLKLARTALDNAGASRRQEQTCGRCIQSYKWAAHRTKKPRQRPYI